MKKILFVTSLTWVFCAMSLAYAETAPSLHPENKVQGENLSQSDSATARKKRKTNAQVWRTQRYEVQMIGNKIGYYRLTRKSDGFVHHVGHPYGQIDSKKLGKVKYYTVPKFRAFIHAQAQKERRRLKRNSIVKQPAGRMAASAKTPTYTTGLGLGYNPSTGYIGTGSQCFNEVTTLTQSVTSSQFSVSTGASSYASQTDVSATVSASYSFFNGDASASYASNYASGANAGSIFFSSVGLFSASNVWYGLNTQGTNNQASGDFSANCGSEFVESIAVGAIVSANFGWSSNSSTASTAIQTAMTANASSGLSSMSVAVSAGVSNSSTSSNTTFTFGTSSLGGGSIITEALANANSTNAAALDSCTSGDSAACNTFAIGFNADISQGISGTGGLIDTYEDSPADLNGLAVFPSPIIGVVGQPTIGLENISSLLSSSGYNDVFSPYSSQLSNYVNVYNQLRTLSNRASYITGKMDNYESSALNVADYITPLASAYAADASSMLTNLGTCLTTATTNNVANVCAPIISLKKNGVTSAYDWYGSSGPNPNNLASYELTNLRNNTIALQYIGAFSDSNGSSWSMDAAWIGELPGSGAWGLAPPNSAINSLPALVGVVDSSWTLNNTSLTAPSTYIYMLPVDSGFNITAALSHWPSQIWSILGNAWGVSGTNIWESAPTSTTLSFLDGCTNTSFSTPCGLTSNVSSGGYTSTASFNAISNFFGP